ncbi:hypothetical protein MRX96_033274 [Rhipicephalus microplus]
MRVGRVTSKPPAEIQSESSHDDKAKFEDRLLSSTTATVAAEPLVQRHRPSLAQLHKERTTSRRLVAPAAPSVCRPVPLKRSIRFRRTTASQLQVIAEVFHGVRLLSPTPLTRKTSVLGEGEAHGEVSPKKAVALSPAGVGCNVELEGKDPSEPKARTYGDAKNDGTELRPNNKIAVTLDAVTNNKDTEKPMQATQPRVRAANVRSEPLRARRPFAMRKHFSEPLQKRVSPATSHKISNRGDDWSFYSPFRSSELDSVNTRSSSVIGSGGTATEEATYDTDALMPISIPTLTITSRQGERTTCNDPTLSSSLCQSHSRHHIPAYALLSPAESSLDAAGTTGETDVHHPVVSTDNSSQHVIACKTEQVAMAPGTVPRVEQWSEAMKEPDTAVGDNAVPPQECKSRKSKADLSAEAAGPQRPVPLPRRIKDILSSNISSVLRTSRNNMMVADRATLDETLTVRTTSPTPCISPSTSFPVSPTLTESTDKTHASGTICVRRQRYMPTSRECDDQATGETTIGTTAVAEASFSGEQVESG